MLSRRTFIQGTAGAIGAMLARPAFARAADRHVRIDSTETPHFPPSAGTLRLSGDQLDRFGQLHRMVAQGGPLRIESHLDGAGQVLLDTVLNASGVRVGAMRRAGGLVVFTIAA